MNKLPTLPREHLNPNVARIVYDRMNDMERNETRRTRGHYTESYPKLWEELRAWLQGEATQ